jgi:gamma-glutamyltranspeptidase/glutathione hydrolase
MADRAALIRTSRPGPKASVRGSAGVAITDHPLATQAAVELLAAGGSAADAALAAAAAQTVIEPEMTTMTGCLSTLYYDARSRTTTYCNGTPSMPAAKDRPFQLADLASGRAVATPGWWAGFDAVLDRFGRKTRREVLAPAISYARDGIEITPMQYAFLRNYATEISKSAEGREIHFVDGVPRQPFEQWRQFALADALEELAIGGADYFYRGKLGQRLVEAVQRAGGWLSAVDLDGYEVRWQEPVRGSYHDFDVVGCPPPDNGGALVIEALNLIELLDLPRDGHWSTSAESIFELMRIVQTVYDDGARQHDPASHELPVEQLLSKGFAEARLALIRMADRTPASKPAHVGSCQVTVVDADGNIATLMNSSMSACWGSGLWVDGMWVAAASVHALRTDAGPGDRLTVPISSTMAFQDDEPVLAAGSPSMNCMAAVVQNVLNLVDYGDSVEQSVHRPRFGIIESPEGQPIENDLAPELHAQVAGRGLPLLAVAPWTFNMGSFDGVHRDAAGAWTACADPRRGGSAVAVAESA